MLATKVIALGLLAFAGQSSAALSKRDDASASPSLCKSESLIYDPNTKKCFNPSRHPSDWNCAYIGKVYNSATEECDDSAAAEACPTDFLYDPSTESCYFPANHPNWDNCAYLGQWFDGTDCSDTNPNAPTATYPWYPTCPVGEYPGVDSSGNPTGLCTECGPCSVYNGLGLPACAPKDSWGQCSCTLICPTGQTVQSQWGSLYCL